MATSVPMYREALVWAQLAEPQTPSLKGSQVPRQQAQIGSASPGPAYFPAGAFCLKLPFWDLLSCIPCAIGPSSEHRSGPRAAERPFCALTANVDFGATLPGFCS